MTNDKTNFTSPVLLYIMNDCCKIVSTIKYGCAIFWVVEAIGLACVKIALSRKEKQIIEEENIEDLQYQAYYVFDEGLGGDGIDERHREWIQNVSKPASIDINEFYIYERPQNPIRIIPMNSGTKFYAPWIPDNLLHLNFVRRPNDTDEHKEEDIGPQKTANTFIHYIKGVPLHSNILWRPLTMQEYSGARGISIDGTYHVDQDRLEDLFKDVAQFNDNKTPIVYNLHDAHYATAWICAVWNKAREKKGWGKRHTRSFYKYIPDKLIFRLVIDKKLIKNTDTDIQLSAMDNILTDTYEFTSYLGLF